MQRVLSNASAEGFMGLLGAQYGSSTLRGGRLLRGCLTGSFICSDISAHTNNICKTSAYLPRPTTATVTLCRIASPVPGWVGFCKGLSKGHLPPPTTFEAFEAKAWAPNRRLRRSRGCPRSPWQHALVSRCGIQASALQLQGVLCRSG